MYKYDEAMDAFAADAAAIMYYIEEEGGCSACLDTGLLGAGHDHLGRVYDPCHICESTEAEVAERDARRQQVWTTADLALLRELRNRLRRHTCSHHWNP